MAQVCGGTSFDQVAERKHYMGERVLTRAADIWAKDGRDALSLDSVIAVLLHIFLSRWSQFGALHQETFTLEKWLAQVGTAEDEARSLMPSLSPAAIADVMSLLLAELSFATEQWALGDPEQPPTVHALNAVEHILFTHKLITRPASPKLPKTVRGAGQEPSA